MEVEREGDGWHQCCCVVEDEFGTGPCRQMVPPDSPFCPGCEDRHPEVPDNVIVTQRLPDVHTGVKEQP